MGRRRRKWWRNCNWFPCMKRRKHEDVIDMHFVSKPPAAEDVTDNLDEDQNKTSALIIRHIDPCIEYNGSLHNTSSYYLMNRSLTRSLVVRRGQPFQLKLHLNRPYDSSLDGISFFFIVDGERGATFGRGTMAVTALTTSHDQNMPWSVVVEDIGMYEMTVEVRTPADCIVSGYTLEIDTKNADKQYSYSWSPTLYILFNPWCPFDDVYMEDEKWRQETVLQDGGLIWTGNKVQLRELYWKYGQFEENILQCALYTIKHVGKLHGFARADPVIVARIIAAAANANDENGVIVGSWIKTKDGTPPEDWLGSTEILQKYYKEKKPVKYAQCWVFAGLVTTICRAIGIPCRPVTNYSSAHDAQGSLTIDYFVNDEGKIIPGVVRDSVWTFHVWNEVWMTRPDLGDDYGGWQVIDATPQEQSEGIWRAGPASVVAVKNGEIKRPYDTAFVYAEVNADKVFWRYNGNLEALKLLGKDMHDIGQFISTKAPGAFEREDLTLKYKFSETSREERPIMLKALLQSEHQFARYYLNEEVKNIKFSFELQEVLIGDSFDIGLIIENNSAYPRTVDVVLRVAAVAFLGLDKDAVKIEKSKVALQVNTIEKVITSVQFADYFKKISFPASFIVSYLAFLEGSDTEFYGQEDYRLNMPNVEIDIPQSLKINSEYVVKVYVINPLPIPLTKGEFYIDAPDTPRTLKVNYNVRTREAAMVEFLLKADFAGNFAISARFKADEIRDCSGFVNFIVTDN